MRKMLRQLTSLLLVAVLAAGLSVSVLAASKPVKKVTLRPREVSMEVGDSRTLRATITPIDADDPSLTWRSNNTDIATVDQNGTVTAVKKGTTTIVVRSANGRSSSSRITVRKAGETIKSKELEMSMSSMTIRIGETRTLWASVTPSTATTKGLAWYTSDASIADVGEDGDVIGVSPGTAIITAETVDGVTATCTVTVSNTVISVEGSEVKYSTVTSEVQALRTSEARTGVRSAVRGLKAGQSATASFTNRSPASSAALQSAAKAADDAGHPTRLRFISKNGKGKTMGSLSFDAKKAAERGSDLLTGIYTESDAVTATTETFSKRYKNDFTVIECEQTGSYGFTASIAARSALSDKDLTGLSFYHYDAAKNKLSAFTPGKISVDKSGFLHFTTTKGGLIVISDGTLAKKAAK